MLADGTQIDIEEAISSQRTEFLGGMVVLYGGDCLSVMATLPENSVDSIVCDPPYHLASIVKRFGGANAAPAKSGKTGAFKRASAGFMGKSWDGGDIAFNPETWALAYRVLKPGGHLIAFGGTRTFHRMATAIEDAGFEIRDMLAWHYASGFPKSHDVAKAIKKSVKVPGRSTDDENWPWCESCGERKATCNPLGMAIYCTECAADDWEGWGTALKPATEPICLARKSLDGTVAENVMKWGVGPLNIDGCRVQASGRPKLVLDAKQTDSNVYSGRMGEGGLGKGFDGGSKADGTTDEGRWPANLLHDGSDCVVAMFPNSDRQQAAVGPQNGAKKKVNVFGDYGPRDQTDPRGDTGSAARFFWSSKASADDRLGSKHPTVKPVDLIQELVRLVTPKGGVVLDPFAGTGTTGEAAWREGMRAILIERETEYQADIARRMDLADKPTKRAAAAKTKNGIGGAEGTPLFATGGQDDN